MPRALPDRLRYLEPVRKQLAALAPENIHEGTDLSVLRRVVRKRIKGLSEQEARSLLSADAEELDCWLSTSGQSDSRLYFVLPILPNAIEVLLTKQPQPPPERGVASMELPEGAKVTVENGCWSVKWCRFYLSLYPSHREQMHRRVERFKNEAKAEPMIDGSGASVGEVRFGEVTGTKGTSKLASKKFKRVEYALKVSGGYIVAVLDSSRGDFDESVVEKYFHTLRVLNYFAPARDGANGVS